MHIKIKYLYNINKNQYYNIFIKKYTILYKIIFILSYTINLILYTISVACDKIYFSISKPTHHKNESKFDLYFLYVTILISLFSFIFIPLINFYFYTRKEPKMALFIFKCALMNTIAISLSTHPNFSMLSPTESIAFF